MICCVVATYHHTSRAVRLAYWIPSDQTIGVILNVLRFLPPRASFDKKNKTTLVQKKWVWICIKNVMIIEVQKVRIVGKAGQKMRYRHRLVLHLNTYFISCHKNHNYHAYENHKKRAVIVYRQVFQSIREEFAYFLILSCWQTWVSARFWLKMHGFHRKWRTVIMVKYFSINLIFPDF